MKYLKILIIISLIPFLSFGQKVVEQIYRTSDSYSPLFGNNSAALQVLFTMTYDVGFKDSVFNVVFEVQENKTIKQGGSLGGGVFAGRLAVSGNSFYSIDRKAGLLVLDYKSLDTLSNYCNALAEYSKQNYGRNRIVFYSIGILRISMEINYIKEQEKPFDRKFYLSIDDATFKLSESEFLKFNESTIQFIKMAWDEYLRTKNLPMPMY